MARMSSIFERSDRKYEQYPRCAARGCEVEHTSHILRIHVNPDLNDKIIQAKPFTIEVPLCYEHCLLADLPSAIFSLEAEDLHFKATEERLKKLEKAKQT